MNGNYEWNKQLAHQRMQQRYRDAALHRQVKQRQLPKEQALPDFRAMMGTAISFVRQKVTAVIPRVSIRTRIEGG